MDQIMFCRQVHVWYLTAFIVYELCHDSWVMLQILEITANSDSNSASNNNNDFNNKNNINNIVVTTMMIINHNY